MNDLICVLEEFNNMIPGLKPVLFLLDVILPDGDGLEICQHLKTDSLTAHGPVLIMSANFQVEKMKEWTYADDCIAKPFDIDDLQNRIAKLIEPKDNYFALKFKHES